MHAPTCAGIRRYLTLARAAVVRTGTLTQMSKRCTVHPAWGTIPSQPQASHKGSISHVHTWNVVAFGLRCHWNPAACHPSDHKPHAERWQCCTVYESVSRGGLLREMETGQYPDRLASTFNRTLIPHQGPATPAPCPYPPIRARRRNHPRTLTQGTGQDDEWGASATLTGHICQWALEPAPLPPIVRRNEHATVVSPFRPLTALAPS